MNYRQGRGSRAASEEPTASGGGGVSVPHGGGALLSPEVLWDKLSNTSDKKVRSVALHTLFPFHYGRILKTKTKRDEYY